MVFLLGDAAIAGSETIEGQDPLKRDARAVRSDSRRAAAKARTRARRASAAQNTPAPAVLPQRSTESTTAVKLAVKHVTPTQTQTQTLSAPSVPSVSTAEPRAAAAVVKVLSKSGKKRMNKWMKKQEELKVTVPL